MFNPASKTRIMQSGDYDVGYGKPPRHTQFKKGQSGNPGGGQKASPDSPGTILYKVLGKRVKVSENGKTRSITVDEARLHAVAQQAMKGNLNACKFLEELKEKYPPEQKFPAAEYDPSEILSLLSVETLLELGEVADRLARRRKS